MHGGQMRPPRDVLNSLFPHRLSLVTPFPAPSITPHQFLQGRGEGGDSPIQYGEPGPQGGPGGTLREKKEKEKKRRRNKGKERKGKKRKKRKKNKEIKEN